MCVLVLGLTYSCLHSSTASTPRGGKEAGAEPAEVSRSGGALAAAVPTWRLVAPRTRRCVRPPSAPGFPPLFALVRKAAVLGWPRAGGAGTFPKNREYHLFDTFSGLAPEVPGRKTVLRNPVPFPELCDLAERDKC